MSKEFDIARRCAETMNAADVSSRALRISVEVTGVGMAAARLEVTNEMMNGLNVCHGGHIFALADTAFAFACNCYDRMTFAAGANIDFLRPARVGDRLLALAAERHRGGRSGVYDVSVTNQDGEEIAVFTGRSLATKAKILSGA
jgi:acyl-CoA thioesterase